MAQGPGDYGRGGSGHLGCFAWGERGTDGGTVRRVFYEGDNERIAGWMQCHYRLQFDESGYPRMYVFRNCRAFIRTVPLMLYSQTRPEDLDTAMEDHVCDEWRYFCMSRPVRPMRGAQTAAVWSDPLDQLKK